MRIPAARWNSSRSNKLYADWTTYTRMVLQHQLKPAQATGQHKPAAMENAIRDMNRFGAVRAPFIFIIDYQMQKPAVIPIDAVNSSEILYDFNGFTNSPGHAPHVRKVRLEKNPISFDVYKSAFDLIVFHQMEGDSYLANLTFPTRIDINLSLKEIFLQSRAPYRLWFKDRFVVFSPEPFVRINDGKISSFPMKGTIDASIPNAKELLLGDEKEFAEHVTIVDLIRNDLNIVASDINVERFQYIDMIDTNAGGLLQASSMITGTLAHDYHEIIGNIIAAILPAGSITGAPKKKTVEIIREAENYERGYYTGICGLFDGENLDSCVMIRFIEKTETGTFFKSGGGITVYSDPVREYQELIDKVYVPII